MDLELRGQGDVAGTRQSGRPGYKLADPWRDEGLLLEARDRAREIVEEGRLDTGGEYEPLRRRLRGMLEAAGALPDVG